jgi:hypothetical protein
MSAGCWGRNRVRDRVRDRVRCRVRGWPPLLAIAAALLAGTSLHAEESGEVRLRADALDHNTGSASVLASRLSGVVPLPVRSEAGLEGTLSVRREMLNADVLVQALTDRDGNTRTAGRVNELYLAGQGAGLQFAAGRRVVQWDVGTVFRPNDLIEQDQSRLLLATKPQGRGVLQAEYFAADSSASLVLVNPQKFDKADDEQRGVDEAALAGMVYTRSGSTDLYGFARAGHHTGASLGAAFVNVVSDSVSVYASARALQRHDGWTSSVGSSAALASSNPWQLATRGRAGKMLVGANWTGESRQSVIAEWWYDGTTLKDSEWDAWLARTASLTGAVQALLAGQSLGPPPDAFAGNLAWQDAPLNVPNRRRDTLFLRLSWQPDPWQLTLDTLYNPADSGHITTAAVQWQGNSVRLNAAFRWFGGPADALSTRLPQRRSGLLAAVWAY